MRLFNHKHFSVYGQNCGIFEEARCGSCVFLADGFGTCRLTCQGSITSIITLRSAPEMQFNVTAKVKKASIEGHRALPTTLGNI